jgi:hypothetical protein
MSVNIKDAKFSQMPFLKSKTNRTPKDGKSILYTAPKIDRGGLGKVMGGARDLSDSVTEINGLHQYFVVKGEVIRVHQ